MMILTAEMNFHVEDMGLGESGLLLRVHFTFDTTPVHVVLHVE